MEKAYQKMIYRSKLHFGVHHVWGYQIGEAYSSELHYDTEYTLAYFKKADATIQIEGNIYNIHDGDMILLDYNELHRVNMDGEKYSERITVFVNADLMRDFPHVSVSFFEVFRQRSAGTGNLIPAEQVKANGIDERMEQILQMIASDEPDRELLVWCRITELLYQLSKIMTVEGKLQILAIDSDRTISEVIKYLNLHFREEIDCDEIALRFHISRGHLFRTFKYYVGVSLWEYVIRRRLLFVNDLLRENCAIEEACFQAGFRNYSNFYRLYKKHTGITPMEFKKQH